MSCSEEPQKSSSEILNELFSTFNSTFPAEPQKKPKKAKKEKKEKGERSSKKRKHSSSSPGSSSSSPDKKLKKRRKDPGDQITSFSSSSPPKKKKRKNVVQVVEPPKGKKKKREKKILSKRGSSSSSSKIPIGDGFVVMNKSEQSQGLEDGEIVEREEDEEEKKSKKSRRRNVEAHEERLEGLAKSTKKLSASEAYKLDAEEKLLLGYDDAGRKLKLSSSKSAGVRQAPPMRRSPSPVRRKAPRRSRSRSPSSSSSSLRHRVAPPRDKNTYKSSYLKFQKEREYDYEGSGRDVVGSSSRDRDQSSSSSSRSYDTASYYDYHASRSRTETSSARSGFGYVGKSYYYDDVVEEARESSSSSSRSKSYGTSAWRHRHRSRSRSKSPRRRSYYHPDDIIDKAELLEIARRNAKRLLQRGVLPTDIFSRDQIVAIRAGGKNVDELTDYCRRLAKRDARGDARSDDSGDEAGGGGRFIHHPFVVKDKPLPTITMNIRNAVPLPVRTPQEMAIESTKRRSQFPVSSGTQHRFKELEWKPVEGDNNNKAEAKDDDSDAKAIVSIEAATTAPPPPPSTEDTPSTTSASNIATVAPMPRNEGVTTELLAIEAPPPAVEDTGITLDPPKVPDVDISCVIGLRLKAMRALQENPESNRAKNQLEEATKMMKNWADAKALEPKFLSVAELSSGPQAWAKRDQLRKTKQLDSGMGMHLLQKMGWKPGEGLGKNKEGQLEPLALDVKTDKKGLTAAVEELMFGKSSKGGGGNGGGAGPSMPSVYDLSGKHPVSALMELTAKRRWGAPEFEMCFEHGPPHKRQFVYKVIVNGVEYQPCVAVGNKKQAKANAAAFCLQSLGLLPSAAPTPPQPPELLQTVPPPPIPLPPQPSSSDNTFCSSNAAGLTGGNAQPLTNNPLQQTFSSGRNFLQTVQVGEDVRPSPVSSDALMPPPPPPPPLINFLRK